MMGFIRVAHTQRTYLVHYKFVKYVTLNKHALKELRLTEI